MQPVATYLRTESLPGDRAAVWAVVGDVTSTDNEHLVSQEIIEGDGIGMVRRCVDTSGNAWTETCTLWEPGHSYRFDLAVDEHPLPMRAMAAQVQTGSVEAGSAGEITTDIRGSGSNGTETAVRLLNRWKQADPLIANLPCPRK